MRFRFDIIALAALALPTFASTAQATPFTGPVSAFYLDGYATQRIYVVRGTSVTNSFAPNAGTGGYHDARLAVTTTVNTVGFGSGLGAGSGGQYSLTGTPTGVTYAASPTPGYSGEILYDGTSDGAHNYSVQYSTQSGGTHSVIRYGLDWQNPTALFHVANGSRAIAYDPTNNSLWVGNNDTSVMSDFALDGTLLSQFTATGGINALGYDAADNTLWYSYNLSSTLKQYSTSGTLLQSGTISGLPNGGLASGDFIESGASPAGVPEPASLALLGMGAAALATLRRRHSTRCRSAAPIPATD